MRGADRQLTLNCLWKELTSIPRYLVQETDCDCRSGIIQVRSQSDDWTEVWDRKPSWIRQFVPTLYTQTGIYLDNPTPAYRCNAVCRSGSASFYSSLSKYFVTLWPAIDTFNARNPSITNLTHFCNGEDYTLWTSINSQFRFVRHCFDSLKWRFWSKWKCPRIFC